MTQRPMPRRPASPRQPARRSVPATPTRGARSVRRASAGLSPVRAGALLALLLSAAAVYGVANSAAFKYEDLRLEGRVYTDRADVEAVLAAARDQNLFQLETGPLAEEVTRIPTVRDASVSVSLPDTLVVSLEEREAIMVWRVGERRYLVDADGALFGRLEEDATAPATATTLPVVEDRRAASAGLSIDRRIDPVDLDAATRLASLVPSDVGSEAEGLVVQVTDANGFVVRSKPGAWSAVFGFYTPSLRTPELIPGQVRLLRSLLIGREHLVQRIVLASETDGTFIPRATPAPQATTSPTPAP